MAKAGDILRVLIDEIPKTVAEIAETIQTSKTHVFNLCESMAAEGTIYFRKSAGTWIAWRKNVACSEEPSNSTPENKSGHGPP